MDGMSCGGCIRRFVVSDDDNDDNGDDGDGDDEFSWSVVPSQVGNPPMQSVLLLLLLLLCYCLQTNQRPDDVTWQMQLLIGAE